MSQAPAMPLWCDAYLADTMHLSLEEHGAYLKLLMITWRNNGKPLPDDDQRMARMLGVTSARWRDRLRPVLTPFFDLSDGTWRQKRLEKEWAFVAKNSKVQREKARKRWSATSLENNDSADAAASTGHKPSTCPHTHTHTHTSSLRSDDPLKPPRERGNDEFERWWQQVPRKVAKGRAERAYRNARKSADADALLSGIMRYAAECQGRDANFVAHPASWLSGKRWLDDPAPPPFSQAAAERSSGRLTGFAAALAALQHDPNEEVDGPEGRTL